VQPAFGGKGTPFERRKNAGDLSPFGDVKKIRTGRQ
jgi:hypothetical protein